MEVYRNDLHEMLVSARLGWGIGHSGAQGISANAPDLLQPGIFFGKGFGDFPIDMMNRWLISRDLKHLFHFDGNGLTW